MIYKILCLLGETQIRRGWVYHPSEGNPLKTRLWKSRENIQKTHITHSRTVCHCMLLKKQQWPIFGIRWYKLKFTYNHYVLRYYEVGASSVHQGLSCVVLQAARPAAQASQRLASEEPVSCCGQDLLSKYREGSHWFPGRDGKFRNLQMNAHKFRHYYTLLHIRNDAMHLQGSHLLSLSPFIPPKWQLKTRNFYE